LSALILHDLAQESPSNVIRSDVCVIGAGPVGLAMARALADRHRSVTLLERGPARAIGQSDSQEIAFDRRPYRGATVGRAFGAGGTSTLWGGQLLPVREADLHRRAQIGTPAWPVSHAELAPHFDTLESWLQVMPGSYALGFAAGQRHALADLRWAEWQPRFSKWIPFGRRNVYVAFECALAASKSLRGFVNARAHAWHLQCLDDRQRVTRVSARSANGGTMSVQARAYVICAGALESARCVLELNEAAGSLGSGVDDLAGRFLHDHLSLRLARVKVVDHARFQGLFAPIFTGKTMRSLRLELSEELLSQECLPALYVHFLAEAAADSGFALMRNVFRGIQQRKLGAVFGNSRRIPQAIPSIAAILFDRFVRHRLSFPRDAEVFLYCDFEQEPLRENRIYLGERGSDGHRALRIDWDSSRNTVRVATAVQSAFRKLWTDNGLDEVARLEFAEFGADAKLGTNSFYDIYHPAGTTRMSSNPLTGVVDPNLLVYGTTNAYVVGSAVFPSMGAANPTFTAMALALRLAAFIDADLPRATN
jgi:choline dehydrogenase-like flavoprotein